MSLIDGGPLRALILSGGGARGAYEAGVIKALLGEEGFDIVCGTSIGVIDGRSRRRARSTISSSVPFELAMLGFDRQDLVDDAFALGVADGHAAAGVNSFLRP